MTVSSTAIPKRGDLWPKHIAIRAMLWDGGYGKTLLKHDSLADG